MSIVSSLNEVQVEQIAARVRTLVAGRYGERVFDAAVGIGMSDVDLSALLLGRAAMARQEELHEELVDGLARVVRHFGVDPSWLVTGRYNVRSHVAAEELRSNLVELRFLVDGLLAGPDRAVEMQPVGRADLRPTSDDVRSSADWLGAPTGKPKHDGEAAKRRRGDEPER